MSTDDLAMCIAWFENQGEKGEPALGDPETTTWGNFVSVFEWRREGEKDECNFIPAVNMIRRRSSQEEVEIAAYAEGERLGLNRADVISTAVWVVEQFTAGKAA